MIACREAVERLWTYLDRALDRTKEAELEQHLGLCRHCCGELEFAKQVREKLKESAGAPLTDDGKERLTTFVRRLAEK
ncbi:MAG TPA: zf-HC2 domain-containing protein [Candidatus Limnocylindria bacterium]|nr:zf-HC2 domain-containing protein [Candidatus Limnocylindria bacterium]